MSVRRFRPRRSLRSELLPISIAVLMPIAMVLIFPYGALVPVDPSSQSVENPAVATCAFVELDEAAEVEAIVAARTAWHVNSSGIKNLRIEMFADDLPEDDAGPVLDIQCRTRVARDRLIGYEPVLFPTDFRAKSPISLGKPDAPSVSLPFAREELLKLD